ncbi:MAG: methyltransferase [Oleiphilaceae bacterium]|nr:methyltransferase [Oleiphilaceae bacterium]
MEVELFVRHFLGIYFVLVGLNFASASLALRRRTGVRQIHYGVAGSATWWHRQAFNLFRTSILAVVVLRIVWPSLDHYLGLIQWLCQPPVLLTGVLLMLVSFTGVAYTGRYMHNDWRSGIDPESPSELVTSGPFSRSRNPLFLAVMTGQLGFFLALPSVFSLTCLLVGAAVLTRQVRAEEAHLEALHGEAYRRYRQQVRRWV